MKRKKKRAQKAAPASLVILTMLAEIKSIIDDAERAGKKP